MNIRSGVIIVSNNIEVSQLKKIITKRIFQLTVPSADDGYKFIRTDRLDLILDILKGSEYECYGDMPLAKVYRHQNFQVKAPNILVSCHIDSLYNENFASLKDAELQGTFDNSACNGVLVEAMIHSLLPEQVLISFTGDEEHGSKGAVQTIKFLQKEGAFDSLEMVIVLDITEEGYRRCHHTIENYFVEKGNVQSILQFRKKQHLKKYLTTFVDSPVTIKNGDADEAWQYDEYDLNCFSLCLPCRLLGGDMHDDIGVAIRHKSLEKYSNSLQQLAHGIIRDLGNGDIS
jgi:hypothetical protein